MAGNRRLWPDSGRPEAPSQLILRRAWARPGRGRKVDIYGGRISHSGYRQIYSSSAGRRPVLAARRRAKKAGEEVKEKSESGAADLF